MQQTKATKINQVHWI